MEDLLHYCLMDAKLVYQLCHLPHIKLGNFSDTSVVRINYYNGKWSTQQEEVGHFKWKGRPHHLSAGHNKHKSPAPCWPTVAGVPCKLVILGQILASAPLTNPEMLDWIVME
jgi:hypothetical protein